MGAGNVGENRCDGSVETCFNVIVMILTSLNSPEKRVLSCGAPRDSRKLDHKYCVCVRVSVYNVSSQSGLGFHSSGTIVVFSVK